MFMDPRSPLCRRWSRWIDDPLGMMHIVPVPWTEPFTEDPGYVYTVFYRPETGDFALPQLLEQLDRDVIHRARIVDVFIVEYEVWEMRKIWYPLPTLTGEDLMEVCHSLKAHGGI